MEDLITVHPRRGQQHAPRKFAGNSEIGPMANPGHGFQKLFSAGLVHRKGPRKGWGSPL
jgi:hypothetical protein